MSQDILIIGPNWVGDMVMAQSLFKLLKHSNDSCSIDVVAPSRTVGLLNRMPEIRQAIETPFISGKFEWRKHFTLAKQLRDNNYEQAIVLPNSFKSALVPWLAGIKKRTGWVGETRHFLLNDIRRLDTVKYPLMVERYIALGLPPETKLTPSYFLPTLQVSIEFRDDLIQKHPYLVTGRPIMALCIGAEYGPSKCWPAEYYANVANQKIHDGWDIWLVGSSKERVNSEKIMDLTQHRCIDLTGKFSLLNVVDLLSLVNGVVTNDTGLMHIAAALKKPMVVVYGSSSPNFTPPLLDDAIILQTDLTH